MWLLQAFGAGNVSFCARLMQAKTFGVLKVTKEKETKSPLLAQTERTAGKIAQANGSGGQVKGRHEH